MAFLDSYKVKYPNLIEIVTKMLLNEINTFTEFSIQLNKYVKEPLFYQNETIPQESLIEQNNYFNLREVLYFFNSHKNIIKYGNMIIEKLEIFDHQREYYEFYGKVLIYCGKSYLQLQNYEEAFRMFVQSLNFYGILKKKDKMSNLMNKIGEIYHDTGSFYQALKFYEEALKINKKLYGKEHQLVALCLNNIGDIYSQQKNNYEAFKYHNEALNMRKNCLGENHQDVAVSLNNLGQLYQQEENYTKAKEFYSSAISIAFKAYGTEEHEDIGIYMNNLGMIEYLYGNYGKALECFQKALNLFQKQNTVKEHEVATTLNNLAETYQKQGNIDEAFATHEKAFTIRKNLFGLYHSATIESLNNIGWIQCDLQEYEKSLQIFQQVLQVSQQMNLFEYIDDAKGNIEQITQIMNDNNTSSTKD